MGISPTKKNVKTYIARDIIFISSPGLRTELSLFGKIILLSHWREGEIIGAGVQGKGKKGMPELFCITNKEALRDVK